ncbi:MAG: hypothetical protein MPN21_23580 [Thermoanaerobaculia bacterium]|nr:hypothetical protein [Thermoanaerobaculia bacterium]
MIVAHEACHAALGCHYAGFASPSLVLTNEGQGNFGRNSLFWYEKGHLTLLESDQLPWYGTGFGWTALGYALGFGIHPSVAGTVMGMAGYARPTEEFRDAYLRLPDELAQMSRSRKDEILSDFMGSLGTDDSFERRAGLAATLQSLFTASVCDYLRRQVRERRGVKQVVLSGGCALNVVCNSAAREALPMELAIPPAPNDAGIALGAAIYAQQMLMGTTPETFWVYSNGSADSETEAAATLESHGLEPYPVDLEVIAEALAVGRVVGWMAGRSEIGPRALGTARCWVIPRCRGSGGDSAKRSSGGSGSDRWRRSCGGSDSRSRSPANRRLPTCSTPTTLATSNCRRLRTSTAPPESRL